MRDDSMRALNTYAISVWDWIAEAIYAFRKSHRSAEHPKFLVMHPVIYANLKMDKRMLSSYYKYNESVNNRYIFMGIEVKLDEQTKGIKFITSDNKVEYI
jgi:hypothetical protein